MTETTQPDPQIIARVVLAADMNIEWDPPIGIMLRNGTASMESRRNGDGSRTVTIRARKPLTVADTPPRPCICAAPGTARRSCGSKALRTASPFCMDILDGEDAGTEDFALRDHLAATLPTVTD